MKTNKAYEILQGLVEAKNESNSLYGNENPVTPRVNYIVDQLLELEIFDKIHTDVFADGEAEDLFYLNLEVTFDAGTETSVMFVAHHDVNNPLSENCQDNSASVSNLLALIDHYTENPPNKTVHFVFTDCEEFGGAGAKRLSDRINEGVFGEVEYVINLELTANGQNLWYDGGNLTDMEGNVLYESELLGILEDKGEFYEAVTPFNDSYVLRKQGIDSICIGTLQDADMRQVEAQGYCQTWAVCHKMNDTFQQAVATDMDNFVEFLSTLVEA